ncbi:hypothetical protein GCM10011390_26630 [Aureimonas endophytica]|uniref:Uncharacterized protein n=1 Tax=Aureimonas endophytica TaxID=2027858 RepID=A0A917E5X9_9HYPH|nr:hypothetical protein [Aureimonas endophytica]GGE06191.1 hypothetical protein GCM10011390_26630 [Aureimonas endophytica]
MLLLHPGWVAADMGTLAGRVQAEIELSESVEGIPDVVERHRSSGSIQYRDYQDRTLPW